jgi:hypothetical protein
MVSQFIMTGFSSKLRGVLVCQARSYVKDFQPLIAPFETVGDRLTRALRRDFAKGTAFEPDYRCIGPRRHHGVSGFQVSTAAVAVEFSLDPMIDAK